MTLTLLLFMRSGALQRVLKIICRTTAVWSTRHTTTTTTTTRRGQTDRTTNRKEIRRERNKLHNVLTVSSSSPVMQPQPKPIRKLTQKIRTSFILKGRALRTKGIFRGVHTLDVHYTCQHTHTHARMHAHDMHTLQRLCTVINALQLSLQIESNQVKCCEGPWEKEQVWRWPLTIKSLTFGNKACPTSEL